MTFIADQLAHLLMFIYSIVGNYGLAIILFTIFVKLCLFPLYYKQVHSMTKMQELTPKINEINLKYKGKTSKEDMRKKQEETARLYQESGTNPAMGCLPLLIQMPILISLFTVLKNSDAPKYIKFLRSLNPSFEKINYKFLNGIIGSGFDLSKAPMVFIKGQKVIDKVSHKAIIVHDYKYGLLIVLATLTTYLSIKLFQNPQQQQAQPGSNFDPSSMMKTMLVFSSVMTGFMAYSMPAGMGVYWTTVNIFQIGQQYVLYNKFYKPQLEKNKIENSKPSTTKSSKSKK